MITKKEAMAMLRDRAELPSLKETQRLYDIFWDFLLERFGDEGGYRAYPGVIFDLSYREPRTSRNVRTGEPIEVPGTYYPRIRVTKVVRDVINEAIANGEPIIFGDGPAVVAAEEDI